MAGQRRGRIVELSCHPVQAHPGETDLGFGGEGGVANQDDIAIGRKHVPGPFGEATLESDVDRFAEVAGREVRRLAGIEEGSAAILAGEYLIEAEQARRLLIEQCVRLAVGPSVEGEVAGTGRLPFGD